VSAGPRVHKYPIPMPNGRGRSFVVLPSDAVLLSVGLQNDALMLWALTDPDYVPEQDEAREGPRRLIVSNTGRDIPSFPSGAAFLGTVTTTNGIVWHVWDGDAETTA
jgi:hypothetical protein